MIFFISQEHNKVWPREESTTRGSITVRLVFEQWNQWRGGSNPKFLKTTDLSSVTLTHSVTTIQAATPSL